MIEVQVWDVFALQKPFMMRWCHINNCFAQVFRNFNSRREILCCCYTLTSSNNKQKLHTITNNGLYMCKTKKVYTHLVFFLLQLIKLGTSYQVDAPHGQDNKNFWSLCTAHSCLIFHHEGRYLPTNRTEVEEMR